MISVMALRMRGQQLAVNLAVDTKNLFVQYVTLCKS